MKCMRSAVATLTVLTWTASFLCGAEATEQAVAAVTRAPGRVTRDEPAPGRPVAGVRMTRGRRGQEVESVLKEMAPVTQLRELTLPVRATDAELKLLAPFTSLQSLSLPVTQVTDPGLKALAPLVQLKSLNLRWCQGVGDEGMKEV